MISLRKILLIFISVTYVALSGSQLFAADGFFWASDTSDKILFSTLDGSTTLEIITGLSDSNLYDVEFNSVDNKLYYAYAFQGVHRVNLDGSNDEQLVAHSISHIALESDNNKLITSDPWADIIYVSDFDGGNQTNFSPGGDILSVAVDGGNSHVYLPKLSNGIFRYDYDGANPNEILDNDALNYGGITVDVGASKIYYINTATGDIRKVDFDGNNDTLVINIPGISFWGDLEIDTVNNKLYFSDGGTKIYSVDTDGNNLTTLIDDAANGTIHGVSLGTYAIAASIPTLSEWGMIIMSILLGITAVVYIRRQRMDL